MGDIGKRQIAVLCTLVEYGDAASTNDLLPFIEERYKEIPITSVMSALRGLEGRGLVVNTTPNQQRGLLWLPSKDGRSLAIKREPGLARVNSPNTGPNNSKTMNQPAAAAALVTMRQRRIDEITELAHNYVALKLFDEDRRTALPVIPKKAVAWAQKQDKLLSSTQVDLFLGEARAAHQRIADGDTVWAENILALANSAQHEVEPTTPKRKETAANIREHLKATMDILPDLSAEERERWVAYIEAGTVLANSLEA